MAETIPGGPTIGGGGYRPLDPTTVTGYLSGLPAAAERLGGTPDDWSAVEVGDGNLNLVFIVSGPDGRLCVKQALPYVRLVGESWPLPLTRAYFEHEALSVQAAHVPDLVPEVQHFDPDMALTVMEALHPHIILRKGLIAGTEYPKLAADIGRFCALTLFKTSDLHLPAGDKKRAMARFAHNIELCRITEDLVFTDPYREHELNRWTSPGLDDAVRAIRADGAWKVAVQELKHAFLTRGEALIHGDLHTGSIMVTADDTRAIDPEFAFYGPMGFDLGAYIGNLFLAYFAQRGHEERPGGRDAYRAWLLEQAVDTWAAFADGFVNLWRTERRGSLHPTRLYEEQGQAAAAEAALRRYLERLQQDALGFAGAKMARRILGLAHVADLETIVDPKVRAGCERRALRLARDLVVGAAEVGTVEAAAKRAEAIEEKGA